MNEDYELGGQTNILVGKGNPIKIRTWSESTNMVVVPLDNFVILRIEFMHSAKMVLMPFLNSLCLIGGNDPRVVLVS